jgi:hypothetical protein
MELFTISLIPVVLAILAILSSELGVDSRDESDDQRRPYYPVGLG